MNTKYLSLLFVLWISACTPMTQPDPAIATAFPTVPSTITPTAVLTIAPTATPTAPANADRFAGMWVGNMTFTDYEGHNEDVVIMIPTGCTPGDVCGDLTSKAINCTWEMTLETLDGGVFRYKITNVRPKGCPLLGEGKLTLQPDGALMAEHKTPLFVATGVFTQE